MHHIWPESVSFTHIVYNFTRDSSTYTHLIKLCILFQITTQFVSIFFILFRERHLQLIRKLCVYIYIYCVYIYIYVSTYIYIIYNHACIINSLKVSKTSTVPLRNV